MDSTQVKGGGAGVTQEASPGAGTPGVSWRRSALSFLLVFMTEAEQQPR